MKWNFERIAVVRECLANKTGFINRRVDQRSAIHREQWSSF